MPRAHITSGFGAASLAFLSPATAFAAPVDAPTPLITAQKPFITPLKTDASDDKDDADASSKTPDRDEDNTSWDISGDFSLSAGNGVNGNSQASGVNISAGLDLTKEMPTGTLDLTLGSDISTISPPNPSAVNATTTNQYGATQLTTITLSYTTPTRSLTAGIMTPAWNPLHAALEDEAQYIPALNAFSWINLAGVKLSQKIQAGNAALTATVTAGKELGRDTQGLTYAAMIDVEKGKWVVEFLDYRRARDADDVSEQLVNFYISYSFEKGRQHIQIAGDASIDKNPIDGTTGIDKRAEASVTDTVKLSKVFSVYGAVIGGISHTRSQRPDSVLYPATAVYVESGFSFTPQDDDNKSVNVSITRGTSTLRAAINLRLSLY